MQRIPDSPQLGCTDMLSAPLDFHQRLPRHLHTFQLEEADQRMYQEKRRFYSVEGNDRRNRREGGRKENVSNRI